MRIKNVIAAFILLPTLWVYGQEQSYSGTIVDENSLPLPGASIVLLSTGTGIETDESGKFTLSANAGDSILVSFMGYEQSKRYLSASTEPITVKLGKGDQELEEVVVSALGIKRKKKTLTYSAQEISSDNLNQVKDLNPLNSISGKIAGVSINRSASGAGGSVKVTIRGNSSVTNNQPLYVIDGVPMLNTSSYQPNSVFGGTGGERDGGDVLSLLNPNDIESMTVLKGASAAALYGNEGSNGVILITTKRGKEGKSEVTISSNTSIDEARLYYDIPNRGHIDDFFQTGITQVSSVTLTSGSKNLQNYLSYSNTENKGVMPTNTYKMNSLNLRETANFFENKLKVDGNVNFSQQNIANRATPGGYYFNPLVGLYGFPTDKKFGDYYDDGKYEKLNVDRNLKDQNWYEDRDLNQNPYWILNRAPTTDNSLRFTNAAAVSYNPFDDNLLSIKARVNYDFVNSKYTRKAYAGTNTAVAHANGRYIFTNSVSTQLYMDMIATINKDISPSLSFNTNIGTSFKKSRLNDATNLDSGVSGGLSLTNVFTISNFATSSSISQTLGDSRAVSAVFGNMQFGFEKHLYLDISARNDWSSTLVNTSNNSFFYPSVGISEVLSEVIEMPSFISFGKVRASYAIVGKDLPSFITSPTATVVGGILQNPVVGPKPGESLEPEKQTSIEVGTEWNFRNNKTKFGFTYYNNTTENQFLQIEAPNTNSEGYKYYAINAGSIENQGIEISLDEEILNTGSFSWESGINFSLNKNKVLSLPKDLGGRVILTPPGQSAYQYTLIEGEAFGQIEVKKLKRNEAGVILLDKDGILQTEGDFTAVGSSNPDFKLGWSNTFKYDNFTLGFLINGSFGGKIASMTQGGLDSQGVSADAIAAIANGGKQIDALIENEDGTTTAFTGKYNPDGKTPNAYYATIAAEYGRNGALGEYVYDATYINLREISLAYKFNFNEENFFKNANLSFTVRNAFFLYKEAPFDPSVSVGTGEGLQGLDAFSMPNTTSIGLNLNITF